MGRKIAFISIVLLVALVAGLYLSGRFAMMFLGLDAAPPHWHVYIDYLRTLDLPQVRPFAAKIRAAGYVGFGLPMLGWIGLLAVTARRPVVR